MASAASWFRRQALGGLIIYLLFTVPSVAFEAEEHKLVGDLGAQWALSDENLAAVLRGKDEATTYAVVWKGPTDVTDGDNLRLVSHSLLPTLRKRRDRKWDEPFFPREDAIEATKPLAVWVGTADKDPRYGGWFSFGDLVALYGDLRRVITCSFDSLSSCSFTDNPTKFGAERRKALRDLAQGWAFFDFMHKVPTALTPSALETDDLEKGIESAKGWATEVIRLAMTNHWHFGKVALKWYIAMHRQALVLVYNAALEYRKSQTQTGPNAELAATNTNRYLWAALHHEAHAAHSLTDLFAPGHTITDRWDTSFGILLDNLQLNRPFPVWQDNIWAEAFHPDALRAVPSKLRGVSKASSNDVDTATTDTPRLAVRSKAEQKLHEAFNAGGAVVRNMKSIKSTTKWIYAHSNIQTGENGWVAFGDGDMTFYGKDKENVVRGNPGHTEWVAAAAGDSLSTLLEAYRKLRALPDSLKITNEALKILDSSAFYEALADVPVQVRNLCFDRKRCFGPDGLSNSERKWQWMSYAPLIFEALKLSPPSDIVNALPVCTGSTTTDLDGDCGKPFDGTSVATEREKAMQALAKYSKPGLIDSILSKGTQLINGAKGNSNHNLRFSGNEQEFEAGAAHVQKASDLLGLYLDTLVPLAEERERPDPSALIPQRDHFANLLQSQA